MSDRQSGARRRRSPSPVSASSGGDRATAPAPATAPRRRRTRRLEELTSSDYRLLETGEAQGTPDSPNPSVAQSGGLSAPEVEAVRVELESALPVVESLLGELFPGDTVTHEQLLCLDFVLDKLVQALACTEGGPQDP